MTEADDTVGGWEGTATPAPVELEQHLEQCPEGRGLVVAICGPRRSSRAGLGPADYVQWFQFVEGVDACIVTDGQRGLAESSFPATPPEIPVLVARQREIAETFDVPDGGRRRPALVYLDAMGDVRVVHHGEALFRGGIYSDLQRRIERADRASERSE